MRIAYICADTGVPVFGWKGSSIHVQEVIRALMKLGAQVELFAVRFGGENPPGFERVRIHKIPGQYNFSVADREKAALAANSDLRNMLESEGSFDMVYERYSLWSFAGMEYARDMGIPGLLEVNSPLIEEQAQHRSLIDRTGAEHATGRAFGAASFLIAVSREVAAYLEHHSVTQKRVHIVPNGVNTDRFPERIKPSLPGKPGTFTVGFVGTLKPWHGLPILVEAYAAVCQRNPSMRLLVVGNGPERQSLVSDLSTRGLMGSVHITGAVSPDRVPGFLASMNVAVAPYPDLPDFYFSPLKIYEYMAAGIPVVASRIGQVAELIQDGTNGILCSPDDPAALADALYRLRCDPGLCMRLGKSARETILRDHTWDNVARRILGLAEIPALQRSNTAQVR